MATGIPEKPSSVIKNLWIIYRRNHNSASVFTNILMKD